MPMPAAFNRGLSPRFLDELRRGRFAGVLPLLADRALDFQIRDDYVNVYAEGQSILHLRASSGPDGYTASIHHKYLDGICLADETGPATGDYRAFRGTAAFVESWRANVDALRANALRYAGWEGPVEQAMIRASMGPNSPVLFLDRQVQVPGVRARMDLIGLASGASPRIVLTELKQRLDNRIQHLVEQARKYQDVLAPGRTLRADVTAAYRKVIAQKIALGALPESVRLPADPVPVETLLVLYAYSPRSELLHRLRKSAEAEGFAARIVQLGECQFTLPDETAWEPLRDERRPA